MLTRYPFDPTGQSTTNRVVGETHAIQSLLNNKLIFTRYGSFYNASMVVKQGEKVLTLNKDYKYAFFWQEATKSVGQPISVAIQIINTKLTGSITLEYQTVGGEYQGNYVGLAQLLATFPLDVRNVYWDEVLEKPEAYVPTRHLHNVNDVFGLSALVTILEDIRKTMERTSTLKLKTVYDRFLKLKQYVEGLLAGIDEDRKGYADLVQTIDSRLSNVITRDELNEKVKIEINKLKPEIEATIINLETTINSKLENIRLDLETERQRVDGAINIVKESVTAVRDDLTNQINTVDNRLTEVDKENDARFTALSAKDTELKNQIDALGTALRTEANAQVRSLTDEVNTLKNRVGDTEAAIRTNKESADRQLQSLNTKIDTEKQAILTTVGDDIAAAEVRSTEALNTAKQQINTNVSALKQTVDTFKENTETRLTNLETQSNTLGQTVTNLGNNLDTKITQLTSELANNLETKTNELKQSVSQLSGGLTDTVETLVNDVEGLKPRVETLENKANEHTTVLTDYQTNIKPVVENLATWKITAESTLSGVSDTINSVAERLSTYQLSNDNRLTEIDNNVTQTNEAVQSLRDDVTTVEGNVTDHEQRITALESKVTQDTATLSNEIKSAQAAQQTLLTQLTDDFNTYKFATDAELSNFRVSANRITDVANTLDTELPTLKNTINSLTSDLQDIDSRLDTLTENDQIKETRLTSLSNQQVTLNSRVDGLVNDIETNSNSINTLDGKVTTNTVEIGTLKTNVTDLTQRVTALETSQTQQDEEIAQLKEKDTEQDTKLTKIEEAVERIVEQNTNGGNNVGKVELDQEELGRLVKTAMDGYISEARGVENTPESYTPIDMSRFVIHPDTEGSVNIGTDGTITVSGIVYMDTEYAHDETMRHVFTPTTQIEWTVDSTWTVPDMYDMLIAQVYVTTGIRPAPMQLGDSTAYYTPCTKVGYVMLKAGMRIPITIGAISSFGPYITNDGIDTKGIVTPSYPIVTNLYGATKETDIRQYYGKGGKVLICV